MYKRYPVAIPVCPLEYKNMDIGIQTMNGPTIGSIEKNIAKTVNTSALSIPNINNPKPAKLP